MKKSCLILLICFGVFIARGLCQTAVTGIVSTKGGTKLPYATVSLYLDSTAIQSIVCDSQGVFRITTARPILEYTPGQLKLRAFYKQLASDWVTVRDNPEPVHLIINDSAAMLSAVVVEADVSHISRQGDRFVFVPARSLTKGSDAFDMLRHVPLIKVDDQSGAFAIINKSATVIYVNNKKSDIPREMIAQLLRSMPADNIISIEVITNPGSEYSSNITGGIVNINLRRAFNDGWLGSLQVLTEQTRFNTSMLNGGITYRKGKFAVNFIPFINRSFNYYRLTNDVRGTSEDITTYNTEYKRKYFVAGGGINIDYQPSAKDFLGFKYWQTNVWGSPQMKTSTRLLQQGKPDTLTNSFYTGDDRYLYNFGNANFRHSFDSLGKTYIDLNIDFNRFKQRRNLEGAFELVDAGDQVIKPLGQYKNSLPQQFWNLSGQVDFKKTISARSSVLVGTQVSHTRVDNDLKYFDLEQDQYVPDDALSQNYQYREEYQSVYISVNQNFGKKLSTTAGLRAERTDYSSAAQKAGLSFDSTYYNLYPSLSASYFVSQQHQFGYSLSRKIIRPNIENLYPGRIYRSNDYFTENNPFLQPTLLLVNELSYLFKRRYSLSITFSGTKNSSARFVIPVVEDSAVKLKETLLNYGTIRQVSVVFNTSFNFFKGKWQLYITPYFNHVVYAGSVGINRVHVVNNDFNLIADNYFQLSKDKTWAAFLTFNYNSPTKDISSERVNTLSSLTLQLRKTIKQFTLSLIASDIYNGKSHTESNLYANYLLTRNHVDRHSYTQAIQFKIRYSFGNNNLAGTRNRNTANQDIRNRAN